MQAFTCIIIFSHFEFIYIATFLKKSGAKNFQREVFDAHCALGDCTVVCDCFLWSLFEKSSAKTFILKDFSAHSGLDRNVSTNQSTKVLVKLFQKLAQVKGA